MHVCTSHQSDLLAAFTSLLLLSEIGFNSAMAVAAAKEKDWVRLLALVTENPQSEHLHCIRDRGLANG